MKGYLRHLAAKASGTQPVVRPRVPSLFEPVPGAAVARGVEVESAEVEVAAPLAREARTAAEPVARNPMEALTHWIEQGHEQRPGAVAPVMPEAALERVVERRGDTRAEPTAAATVREVREASRASEGSEVRRRVEESERVVPAAREVARVVETQAAMQTVEVRNERVVERRETVREERTVFRPATARPAAADVPASLAHVPQSAAVSVLAARGTALREAPSAEPAPVQVTIRRVIVEAMLPAAAPVTLPPRPLAGPRLSLDDYLRQRGGRA